MFSPLFFCGMPHLLLVPESWGYSVFALLGVGLNKSRVDDHPWPGGRALGPLWQPLR